MDSYENEASKFAAQRTKLKNICEAHDLTYTFIKNSYPIKLIIRPIKGVGEQMSMLETASEDSYISPDAYLLFTMKDGVLVYRMSKTFTIEDALFGKIKNIFKNMHSYYCQFFFRELIESGRLNAIGGKMPEIPETEAKEPDLPPEAEPLEEVDAEELDDAEEPAADELTKATEIARKNGGVTQAMLEQQMGVTAEKAIALLDDMESAGVIEFSNGHYTIAAADSEEEQPMAKAAVTRSIRDDHQKNFLKIFNSLTGKHSRWVEQLKKFATEDSQASYQTHEHVNAYGKWGAKKEVVMPEDADKIAYVYKVSENQIDLYKPRDTEAEDASNSAREAARATEQLAREQFAAVTKLMYELRWDFVKDLTPAECKKHLPEILAYSTPILTEYRHMEDDENVLRLLGIGLDEQIREDTELEDALKMFNAYDTEPEKILLAVAFDATDGSREGYWSTEWNGPTGASKFVHRKNDDLDSTYELLTALGYEMADDEKALQDGTHQLFAVYGSGSKADTPCDKCKAAHPECDKCCKTCDDHCNAFQLCRKEYGE